MNAEHASNAEVVDRDDGMNREEWLTRVVNELRPHFKSSGYKLPAKVRVSVGWPASGGLSTKRRVVGQCWAVEAAADKVAQIFVSPTIADGVEAADTIAHELLHAVLGSKAGHGPKFARAAKAIDLTDGKPTQAGAGPELKAKLEAIVEELGVYPHAALSGSGRKVQGTRLLKVVCPDCGYVIRVTRKWLDMGTPDCPCGASMIEDFDFEGQDDDAPAALHAKQHVVEYEVADGDFIVQYVKKERKRGRRTRSDVRFTVIDNVSQDVPRFTILHTRQDVLGFIEAVQSGVYTYPELDASVDPTIEQDGDFGPELDDDEPEWLDNPEDADEYEAGIDEYPAPVA